MNRGEIWLINLDPTVGAEIQKTRPVVIVSSNAIGVLPLRVIVPIKDWKERYVDAAWMVNLLPDQQNGLSKSSAVDTFQIRSVATSRFIRKLGAVSELDLINIIDAIALVVEYS